MTSRQPRRRLGEILEVLACYVSNRAGVENVPYDESVAYESGRIAGLRQAAEIVRAAADFQAVFNSEDMRGLALQIVEKADAEANG